MNEAGRVDSHAAGSGGVLTATALNARGCASGAPPMIARRGIRGELTSNRSTFAAVTPVRVSNSGA